MALPERNPTQTDSAEKRSVGRGLFKKCSGCGTVKAKLALAERIYRCDVCGLVTDRDVNAARNLLSLAASGAERRNAGGGTVRPRPARHDPPNPEPGTPLGSAHAAATVVVAAA